MDKPLWRRFILIGDKKKEKALLALVKRNGLTREDLMLILKSVKIRSANNDNQQEIIEIRKPYSHKSVTIKLPKCAADEIPVLIRKPYSDEITVSVARKVKSKRGEYNA